MRYCLFVFLMMLSGIAYAQELTFKGELIGLSSDTKVILSDLMSQKFHDTASVSNDSFVLNCKLPGAGVYVLRVGLVGQKPEHRIFYLDAGTINLKGDRGSLKKAMISSEENFMKDFLKFENSLQNQPEFLQQKLLADTVIMRTGEAGSYEGLFSRPDLVTRFLSADKKAAEKKVELAEKWLIENPNSEINAYVIQKFLLDVFDETKLKKSLANLRLEVRSSILGKKLIILSNR